MVVVDRVEHFLKVLHFVSYLVVIQVVHPYQRIVPFQVELRMVVDPYSISVEFFLAVLLVEGPCSDFVLWMLEASFVAVKVVHRKVVQKKVANLEEASTAEVLWA